MNKLVILALLLSSILCTQVNSITNNSTNQEKVGMIKYQCSYYEKNKIFSYKVVEDKIPDEQFFAPIFGQDKAIYFSFCDDSDIECVNLSEGEVRGSAIVKDSNDNCVRITSDKWDDAKVTYESSEKGRDYDYLRLSWKGIDDCDFDASQKWNFDIDIVCIKEDWDVFRYTYSGGYDDSCRIKATFENRLGCAIVDFNVIWEFFEENQNIFAIVLICVGLFLNIAGYRVFLVTLFIAGMLATMIGLTLVAYLFIIPQDSKLYIAWIVLGCSLLIGIFVGYVLVKNRKLGVFLLACGGGACLGLMLNNTVMRYAESQALFWVVIVGCGLVLGIASLFLFVLAAIMSTSLVGAYGAVRGVSIFLGHFPNEMTLIEQIKEGIVPKTEWQVWAYVGVILLLFVIGTCIQWRCRPERSQKGQQKKGKKKNGEYYRI